MASSKKVAAAQLQSALPTSYRAWTYSRRGEYIDVLGLNNLPMSELLRILDKRRDLLLVKISHTSPHVLNRLLTRILPHFGSKTPWTIDLDFSGTVAGIGSAGEEAVSRFRLGDPIFGFQSPADMIFSLGGVTAEYAVVPAETCLLRSEKITSAEAAGMAASGVTAMQAVQESGVLEGGRVLVIGGSGTLGSSVTQIAKNRVGKGGTVAVICSERNREYVTELGADEVN